MQTKMVVFDMTGTTVEDADQVLLSFMAAMAAKGYKINKEEAKKTMGYTKPESIDMLLHENFKIERIDERKALVSKIFSHFVMDMLHHYRYSPDVSARSGVEYVFDTLRKRGVKVVVSTSLPRDIADAIIDRLHWRTKQMIDYSVAGDEAKLGRPHTDMIDKAMAKFDITDPAEVAKVGDTPADMAEGISAKCGYVIGVTGGAYSKSELTKEKHTHIVEDLVDILRIVK